MSGRRDEQDDLATLPWWSALAGGVIFAAFVVLFSWVFQLAAWLLRLA